MGVEGALERELDGAQRGGRVYGPLLGTPLLAVAVALAALNLRPAVTSASSLLGDVRGGLGASALWVSVLTAAPTLCFAAAGVTGPLLARRLGMSRAVAVALAVLTVGLGLRVAGGAAVMLGCTFVACAGIAVGNVLIPVVVKESFPLRIGLMTGVYTAGVQGGGALASAVTPSVEGLLGGWRLTLLLWAAFALVALLLWSTAARHDPAAGRAPVAAPRRGLLRNPVAWAVTGFMGSQSFVAYMIMGWLPQVYLSAGVSKESAGLLLAVATVVPVPLSLILLPPMARARSQSLWTAVVALVGAAGTVGLLAAAGTVPWLWAVLVGVGSTGFSLALTLMSLRTATVADAAQLSAMAQGIGYLLASAGPLLFGLLHGATGSWTVSLLVMLGAIGVQVVFGVLAGRPRTV